MSQEEPEQYVSLQALQAQLNSIDQGLNTDIKTTLEARLPRSVWSFIEEKMEFSLNAAYRDHYDYDYYIKIRCNDEEYQRILNEELPLKLSELVLECWRR